MTLGPITAQILKTYSFYGLGLEQLCPFLYLLLRDISAATPPKLSAAVNSSICLLPYCSKITLLEKEMTKTVFKKLIAGTAILSATGMI